MAAHAPNLKTVVDTAFPGGLTPPGTYITLVQSQEAPILATEADDLIAAAKAGPGPLDAWWAARPESIRSAWWAAQPPAWRDAWRAQLALLAGIPLPHGLAGFGGRP